MKTDDADHPEGVRQLILNLINWLEPLRDEEDFDYFKFSDVQGKETCYTCYGFLVTKPPGLWALLSNWKWGAAREMLIAFAEEEGFLNTKAFINGVEL